MSAGTIDTREPASGGLVKRDGRYTTWFDSSRRSECAHDHLRHEEECPDCGRARNLCLLEMMP